MILYRVVHITHITYTQREIATERTDQTQPIKCNRSRSMNDQRNSAYKKERRKKERKKKKFIKRPELRWRCINVTRNVCFKNHSTEDFARAASNNEITVAGIHRHLSSIWIPRHPKSLDSDTATPNLSAGGVGATTMYPVSFLSLSFFLFVSSLNRISNGECVRGEDDKLRFRRDVALAFAEESHASKTHSHSPRSLWFLSDASSKRRSHGVSIDAPSRGGLRKRTTLLSERDRAVSRADDST